MTNKEALTLLENGLVSKLIDNTLLVCDSTENDVSAFLEESLKYEFASVCINPCWVSFVKSVVNSRITISTVVGFPNGANTTFVKEKEAYLALKDGAEELDMVVNIGKFKSNDLKYIENEIKLVKNIAGNNVLKVIIETCLLSEEEILRISKIIEQSGGDYVKTSSGFSKYGATIEDVKRIKSAVSEKIGVKASGGIKNYFTLKDMVYAGATRIGTSRGIDIIKESNL
ncbi:MAG TPA: deoxyribose-phosphate aldolase [Spirochaetota bacterium]|nr:deoxyribose-phosphate aldolase [Spirochaetota bacterium]HOS32859.1 deoxyribose-phosphate aldolase [Spirochaetota bacterium]HOS55310.1 deoxyribose-phosphate aldolase [Spirochaetota bacterium]HPK62930.1 deoxyribose-phosphate aldolase [Spirochaetota bacterium]HQF76907.1 deoxyribose-phosphate aldolase [Spirochaetota bacterium]